MVSPGENMYSNSSSKSTIIGIIIGLISGVLVIPVSFSFAAIIFRSEEFSAQLSSLSKLVLISSAVHQLCFSYFSSLPFAIGQVQDAGLVFLAAIADSIATNVDHDKIIPTTLVILPICTTILGVLMIVVGKLKIANLIQFLPMPVVGGYLAFIGYFCGQAGFALMADVELRTISDWHRLCNIDAIILLLPGLILGILAYVLVRNVDSPFVLPAYMVCILVMFFTILFITGYSIDDARHSGWIAPLTPAAPFYEIYTLFDFSKVDFSQLPRQGLRVLGMFLVVSFSSSLDVAAIEMELGLPLDYDREMETVGLSNLISGMFGGYTGSYIFSQTIFTMRRGILTRYCGYTVAILEIIFFLLPISITSYVPKCFFGSLLILISVDLLWEWLISARKKMLETEWYVTVLTFLSIQISGIELGMLIGIVSAIFSFVLTYANTSDVYSTSVKSSTVVRTFEERAVLIANRGKIVTISLSGYIFFGSAVKILRDVKKHLVLNNDASGFDTNSSPTSSTPYDEVEVKPMYRYSMTPSKRGGNSNTNTPPLKVKSGNSSDVTKYSLVQNEDEEKGLALRIDDEDDEKPRMKKSESFNSEDSHLSSYGSVDSHYSNNNIRSKSSSPTAPRNLNSISVYELSAADIGKHHQNWEDFQRPNNRPVSPNDYQKNSRSDKSSDSTSMPAATINTKHVTTTNTDTNSISADLFLNKLLKNGTDGPSVEEAPTDSSDEKGLTEYVVLDFTNVTGTDATAARSCFLMLMQLMRASGVTVAFTGLKIPIENLLRAHRVIKDDDVVIPVLDDCLEWFEEQILYKANTSNSGSASSSLSKRKKPKAPSSFFKRDPAFYANAWQKRKALRHSISKNNIAVSLVSSMSMRFSDSDLTKEIEMMGVLNDKKSSLENPKSVRVLRRILCDYLEVETSCPLYSYLRSKTLLKYFERKSIMKDDVIIEIGDIANNIFIIEEGSVEITRGSDDYNDDDGDDDVQQRIAKIASGAVFGEAAFFLRTKFQYRYTCLSDCYLWTMSRESYADMEQNDNKLCLIIQHVLLKSLSITQNKLINE